MKKLLILSFVFILGLSVFAQDYRTACANHILVNTIEEAEQIKDEIKSYEDFVYYAKEYSICPSSAKGGDLGCFQKGQMVRVFENAAFNSDTKEIVGPVKTEFGYHLIWVRSKF